MNKCNCLKIQRVLLCLLTFTIFANFIYAQPSSLVLDSYNDEPSFHAIDSIVLKDGFHIPIGKTVLLAVGGLPNLTNSPTSTQNYILTRTFRTPVIPANLNSLRKVDHENQTVQYFDGLGRPIQRIEVMASPSYKDIVTHAEYDGFGREAIKYLPYAEQSSSNGSFKTAAKINQSKFYKADSGWDTHVKKTDQPYAVTVFENSPLNRVSQQGSPGAAWQPLANRDLAATTGRTVETEYGTNVATGAEAVKLWKVTYASSKASGASSTSNYGAGKLYKTISKDENWILANGKGGTIEEYKDFEDRVVLKRNWESNTKALNTYYVYDDFGDLCYVIPPIVSANSFAELNDVNFSRYIYGYHYDNRRRLIEKKIPGKGWEWMAYNANDQEVLRQDALQRATGSWTYTKYDAFGRVAHTGLYTNTGLNTQAAAQSAVDSHPKVNNVQHLWEERPGTLNYIDRAFPIGETVIPHVINYYDDYTFNGATTAALQAVGVTKSQKTQTLLTGMRVTTVDGTAELLTINYYDDRGRLIQSASQNQLGGTDYVTNTYNFPGELLTSKRQHKASASGAVTTILTTNTYDHVGRILQTKKKVNTQAEILQSSLVYNEIGQLKQKDLHGIGTAAVQQISYAYNERGWTTSINNPAAVSAKKRFGMTFTYGGNTRAYNGNIASVQWNTKVAAGQTQTPVQTYSYSYDMLSRLKKAAYTASGKTNFFNEELAYDVMGNIDTLRRTNGSSGWYNHFKYTYVGNQLTKVTDAGTAARSNTFSYDANGNGRTDSRLGITEIQYNYLNLPKKFVKGTQHLLYTYDALGNKRTKTLGAAVTEYVDGIQYKNGIIEFIQTEEGRILPSGSSFIYEYFLKDHLGNTRAVIDHTGAVKQIQDYYAFGMEMNTGAGLNTASNLYKYNGKEKQVELKLDQLDYGARFYNAEIGRWSVIDPLGEMFEDGSLYNYGLNNPLLMVDPTGLLTDTTYVGQSIAPVDVTARKPNRAPHLVEQREIDLYTNISKSVSSLDQRGAIVNSNFEAVKHYYWGKGLPANIGKSSLLKILSSPKFIELHKAVSKGRFKAKQGINVTEFEFHVGRTTISIIGDPFTQTATYTIFEGDGFWDPDVVDEKINEKIFISPTMIPDGKGPNLERFGVPYDYNPTTVTIPFY